LLWSLMDQDDSYAMDSDSPEEEEESKQKSKKQKTDGAAFSSVLDDVYENITEESNDEALEKESGGEGEMLHREHNSSDSKGFSQEELIEKENEKEVSVEGSVDLPQCDSLIPDSEHLYPRINHHVLLPRGVLEHPPHPPSVSL